MHLDPKEHYSELFGECPMENEVVGIKVFYMRNENGTFARLTGQTCPSRFRSQCPYLESGKCPIARQLLD